MKSTLSIFAAVLMLSLGCAAKAPPHVSGKRSLAGNYELVYIVYFDDGKMETTLTEGGLELSDTGGFSFHIFDLDEKKKIFIDGTFIIVGSKFKIDMVFLDGERLRIREEEKYIFDIVFRQEGQDLYLDFKSVRSEQEIKARDDYLHSLKPGENKEQLQKQYEEWRNRYFKLVFKKK